MTNKKVYISDSLSPYENLAAEKHILSHLGVGEVALFLWRNADTIVIGKNQNVWQECKVSEFLESGGTIARRLSGGGAVYHDAGNLNFSFLYADGAWSTEEGLSVIAKALLPFGIEATVSGRNDILAGGAKFSGNAFYSVNGEAVKGVCHHGCILISADMSRLAGFLTVSKEKLESKGVRSVSSRVVNLGSLSDGITVDSLAFSLSRAFSESEEMITVDMRDPEIKKDAEFFASSEWIFGRKIDFTHTLSQRLSFGEIRLCFKVSGGVVEECRVYSDSMEPSLAPTLEKAFKGKMFSYDALCRAIDSIPDADEIKELLYRNI